MEHWAKKLSKKLPQNMFKTRLDTFGNDFGHFWNFWKFFDFLKTFRRLDPPWNTGQKEIFPKNYPKTSSKHVWTLLGTILGIFGLLIVFWFFENISKTRPSLEHCAKKTSRKNFPTTNSKHVWTLLGKILGVFGILIFFWFFKNISKTRPSMEHWAKKIFEKITSKHVQNKFGHFWEQFWAFLEFWKFWFFENFSKTRPYMEHWSKKTFLIKYPKTCSKHFWTI